MATFEFEGEKITVIPQHQLELGDLAFMKEHFHIEGLVNLEYGMANMEPAAWRAILIASIRRTQPGISPEHPGIDTIAVLPLIEEMNAERAERAAAQEKAQAGGGRPTRARSSRASAGKSG